MQKKKNNIRLSRLARLAASLFFLLRASAVLAFEGKPTLSVLIPTIKFTDLITKVEGAGTYLYIPWLAQYIVGLYKYALGIATVIATVMIVIGGFQYVTGGGDASRVGAGKKRISEAVIGLVLLYASYAILATVSPNLLSLDAIKILKIKADPFKSMEYAFVDFGTVEADAYGNTPTDTSGGTGEYRKEMSAVCGGHDGLSLGSDAEKIERLKKIISTWKTVGADQGGAIYVRGGDFKCNYSVASPNFALQQMISLKKNDVATDLSGECADVVTKTAAAVVGVEKTGPIISSAAKENAQCAKTWIKIYNDYITVPPRKAGMACGDCVTFMLSLYECFDKSFDWKYLGTVRTPDACPSEKSQNHVFVLKSKNHVIDSDAIREAATKLKFGDMISWQQTAGSKVGHNFLYTGGAGLGYEIMEMGGGGNGDVVSRGGDKAAKNAGLKSAAGVQAHKSAVAYLMSVGSNFFKESPGCIYAYRPLDKK